MRPKDSNISVIRPNTESQPDRKVASKNYAGQIMFKCNKCSTVVFSNAELINLCNDVMTRSGGLPSLSIGGQKSSLSKCACYFIKEIDWMKKSSGIRHLNSGLIECPNV